MPGVGSMKMEEWRWEKENLKRASKEGNRNAEYSPLKEGAHGNEREEGCVKINALKHL